MNQINNGCLDMQAIRKAVYVCLIAAGCFLHAGEHKWTGDLSGMCVMHGEARTLQTMLLTRTTVHVPEALQAAGRKAAFI
jgi:hypothetical protein